MVDRLRAGKPSQYVTDATGTVYTVLSSFFSFSCSLYLFLFISRHLCVILNYLIGYLSGQWFSF